MKESLKKKICEALPDWLMAYEKSDHDNYAPEYWHYEWKTEDRHFKPIADQEWNWLVDQMVLRTKADNSVDYWDELRKIICGVYDEVENIDGTTLTCMLYATPEQKALAYFAVQDLIKIRQRIVKEMDEHIKGSSTMKDIGWQTTFKKYFGNGPVNRRPRK